MANDKEPLDVQFERELKTLRNQQSKEQNDTADLIPNDLKTQIKMDLKNMTFELPSDDEEDNSSENSYSGKFNGIHGEKETLYQPET